MRWIITTYRRAPQPNPRGPGAGANAAAWTEQVAQMVPRMARIAVRPAWVGILDFQTRFPAALAKRMA